MCCGSAGRQGGMLGLVLREQYGALELGAVGVHPTHQRGRRRRSLSKREPGPELLLEHSRVWKPLLEDLIDGNRLSQRYYLNLLLK